MSGSQEELDLSAPVSGAAKPVLPTIVTSFDPVADGSQSDAPASAGAPSLSAPAPALVPTPGPASSHLAASAVPGASGAARLAVPSGASPSPSTPLTSEPPSPALSASSDGSRSPFITSLALRANDPSIAASSTLGSRKGAHTRGSPSVATMGSVLLEDGSQATPIAVDFEDGTHPAKEGQKERSFSVGAASTATAGTIPEGSTLGGTSAANRDLLPAPAHSGSPKPRSLWQRLTGRKAKGGGDGDDEMARAKASADGQEEQPEDEDPMAAARKAAREAAELPDPSAAEMAPFGHSPRSLYALIDPKSLSVLRDMGGIEGLLTGLKADPKAGLTSAAGAGSGGEAGAPVDPYWQKRVELYGVNRVPERKSKALWELMWAALKDQVLVLLMIAAAISLALGLYTTFGTPPKTYINSSGQEVQQPQVDWVEGVAILAAVAIVTIVGALNDYQKERQFRKLNAQKEDRSVKVVRSGGHEALINVHDLVVGDVALLEPGEIVPADGVLLEGFGVRCDESGATGESDAVRKGSWDEVKDKEKGDCFLISGGKVLEGQGKYVVTAVGQYSFFGKIMMSSRGETDPTPLQLKLNRLAELIAKLGASAGGLLFAILMIKFFVQLHTEPGRSPSDKAQSFIDILIIAVTIVVVAVPEGLPLAVTLALAFATRRMTKMNLLVRVLDSCETMANATVICTDKTGTLTTNQMTVVAGSVGVHLKFASQIAENNARVNANDDLEGIDEPEDAAARDPSIISEKVEPRRGRLDFSMDMAKVSNALQEPLRRLFNQSVAVNTTAFENTDEKGNLGFVGSKTETALLSFAKAQGWQDYKTVRESVEVVQMVPFSSERKAMGIVLKLPDGGYRLLLKGASEVLTRMTDRYVYVENPEGDPRPFDESTLVADADGVRTAPFDHETRGNISRTIIFYANQSLRTLALCYRDFASWPPAGAELTETGDVAYSWMTRKLTLLAVVGIEDPLRPGVADAVATCAGAGVAVKMVTGDNIITAKSIATQCGIYTPGGVIMEGPVFRKLSDRDREEVAPRLQVLARSSPDDKRLLVEHLQTRGEVVGVTGDGTNDGPALRRANVGFSMGIAGTEVAKEASDIVLMDDNFASIVAAIMWGRCVNDSVKKFLQFQVSVNITAVIVTFVTSIASAEESSVLTAVQLLWVNLIMDTFAALALATDPASPESLKRKPDPKKADLISVDMWKMIVGQSIFQLVAVLVLNFAGKGILGMDGSVEADDELKSLVFNTFVFCQIFNQLNARVLGRDLNIFAGFWRNLYFMSIFAIMVGGQILIIFIGGSAFQVKRLDPRDWIISVVIGAISLPVGVIIRLIPSDPIAQFCYRHGLLYDPNALPTQSPQEDEREYIQAIEQVRDSLATFSQIRGGRLRASSFVSRSRQMRKKNIHPGELMAMVPSLVVSSIGAGWQPIKGSLSDPASSDPSKSTAQLWSAKFEVHPETEASDPIMQKFGDGNYKPTRSRSGSMATAAGSTHSRHGSTAGPHAGNTLSVPPSPAR